MAGAGNRSGGVGRNRAGGVRAGGGAGHRRRESGLRILILAAALSVLPPASAAAAPARPAAAVAANAWSCGPRDLPELCRIAAEDQKDRTAPIDWARVSPRD